MWVFRDSFPKFPPAIFMFVARVQDTSVIPHPVPILYRMTSPKPSHTVSHIFNMSKYCFADIDMGSDVCTSFVWQKLGHARIPGVVQGGQYQFLSIQSPIPKTPAVHMFMVGYF